MYIMKTFPKIITSWRHVLIEWEILSDRQGWIHSGDNQVKCCSGILRKSQLKPRSNCSECQTPGAASKPALSRPCARGRDTAAPHHPCSGSSGAGQGWAELPRSAGTSTGVCREPSEPRTGLEDTARPGSFGIGFPAGGAGWMAALKLLFG